MKPRKRASRGFAVCVKNRGNEASLGPNKIYVTLPDADAESEGLVRVDPDGNKVELWEPMIWDDKNKGA